MLSSVRPPRRGEPLAGIPLAPIGSRVSRIEEVSPVFCELLEHAPPHAVPGPGWILRGRQEACRPQDAKMFRYRGLGERQFGNDLTGGVRPALPKRS